ncbi:MAG TPA: hypothetical protein VFR15_06545 [Chloroflexia bacterium]|nr:hypothetical protein [Chloroflexia bacterium]
MTDDQGRHDADHEAPDRHAAGDVSTTGHSSHDVHATDAHGGHGGHGDDAASEVSTLVPVTWRQLVFPLLILLLVGILLWGPVAGAFSPTPPAPPTNEQRESSEDHGSVLPTQTIAQSTPTEVALVVAPTSTSPPPSATSPPSPTTGPRVDTRAIATQTAVALLGEQGVAARAPIRLEFGGATFEVERGTGLLPDWTPPAVEGRATWIQGTYANHIIYLPYNDAGAALFAAAKSGDIIKLGMDTGQTFEFAVTRSERAINGPPTSAEEFTVTTAMAQDHAGVTLFLVGDPAPDRAVVQADFTGNIQ